MIGSGCHCARAPAYPPGSSHTETDNPQSADFHQQPLQSTLVNTPTTFSTPIGQPSHPPPGPSAGIQPALYGSASDYPRQSSLGPRLQTSHSHSSQSLPRLKTQRRMSSNEATPLPDNHSEGSKLTTEKSCCCGPSNEYSPEREVRLSPGPGAFPPPVQSVNIPSSIHHPGTNLSHTVEEPVNRRSYIHDPPSFHGPHIVHTTVYNMPPTYATAENPLTQRQQAFFQQNGYMHSRPNSYYAPLEVIGSAPPSTQSNTMLGVNHTCTCGPSCQCVFCVDHPYNATTRDRVQTLAHLLPDDAEYSPKSPLQSSFFHSIDERNRAVPATNRMHINGILQPSDLAHSRPFHEPSFSNHIYEALPIGGASQAPQSAISSGYLTMQYDYDPMGLGGCTDSTGTCRCGDDCTCVGCLTHSGHDGEHF